MATTPAAKPQASPRQSRMTLASITKAKAEKPPRILAYGVEKVGKSTFAAGAPGAVFVCPEDGLTRIDVPHFPEPQNWVDVLDAISALESGEHEHKYVVFDTVDWIEPMLWDYICKRDGEASIESYGYGKGYTAALDEWRVFLSRLERLRSVRGMGVILLAHSWVKPFKNPQGEDFDRYELKLNAKAGGLLKEWSDAVLFANHETYAVEDKRKRVRGVSTGERKLYTERTAAYDAGNRYNLPSEIALDWDAFEAARQANRPADPAVIIARIEEMLAGITDEAYCSKARAAVEANKTDGAFLARCLNKLTTDISARENAK